MSDKNPLPTDLFSRTLRSTKDNPGAFGSESTIHAQDFYGNTDTWVVQTFRLEDGKELVFLQRNGADGGQRHVLPAEVCAALSRHRDQLLARSRRRAARKGAATRELKKSKAVRS